MTRATPFLAALALLAAAPALAEDPEPPRVDVPVGTSAARGPADARCTIVAFSDFQCPFCARGHEVLKAAEKRYGKDVRVVFKHFPLSFHPEARPAAEIAEAAKAQGRFFEMADWLFAHGSRIASPELDDGAKALGLDVARLRKDAPAGAKQVDDDMALGGQVGVQGTPTFFVNGRVISGAQPLKSFVELCDDEIRARGGKPPAGPVEEPGPPATVAPPPPYTKALEADLDGDGTKESIAVEVPEGSTGRFALTVGKARVEGALRWASDGAETVDVDASDAAMQVAVHAAGPDDAHDFAVYAYDGKSLKEIARFSGVPQWSGDGSVSVGEWLRFWPRVERYARDPKTGTLRKIPVELHFVGIPAQAVERVALQRSRTDKTVVATVNSGTDAILLLADTSAKDAKDWWFLVRADSGVLGWTRQSAFEGKFVFGP
ncbi:MAG: DsbA family protein [Deltaproteobacteria bacterium]|nr:DsbA family protein [Deltaproteobacteria bacterium]